MEFDLNEISISASGTDIALKKFLRRTIKNQSQHSSFSTLAGDLVGM
jgi:hypothetical protein